MDFSVDVILIGGLMLIPIFLNWNKILVYLQSTDLSLFAWGIIGLSCSFIFIFLVESWAEIPILGSFIKGFLLFLLTFSGALLKEGYWYWTKNRGS